MSSSSSVSDNTSLDLNCFLRGAFAASSSSSSRTTRFLLPRCLVNQRISLAENAVEGITMQTFLELLSMSSWSLNSVTSSPSSSFFGLLRRLFFGSPASSPLPPSALTLSFFTDFLGRFSRSSSLSSLILAVHSNACSRAKRRSSASLSASFRSSSNRSRCNGLDSKDTSEQFDL